MGIAGFSLFNLETGGFSRQTAGEIPNSATTQWRWIRHVKKDGPLAALDVWSREREREKTRTRWWFQISNIFYFHPYQERWSNLTKIFQMGWNHQLEEVKGVFHPDWSWNRCFWPPRAVKLQVNGKVWSNSLVFFDHIFSIFPRSILLLNWIKANLCIKINL